MSQVTFLAYPNNTPYPEESKKGEEAFQVLDSLVNNMANGDKVYVLEKMLRNHRTLRQNFTRFCVGWLERLAQDHYDHGGDLRDEASRQLAVEFCEKFYKERSLPRI